jgi:hypothetical protein
VLEEEGTAPGLRRNLPAATEFFLCAAPLDTQSEVSEDAGSDKALERPSAEQGDAG